MTCRARCGILRLVLVLGVLAFAALGAGCSSSSMSSSGAPAGAPAPAGQELFKVNLIADVSALDSGVLGYQAPPKMQTGAGAGGVMPGLRRCLPNSRMLARMCQPGGSWG